MKKLILSASFLMSGVLAYQANAQTLQWWDNNGTSPATSGTWDTTSLNWGSVSSNLTASTVAFTNGNFPIFTAGNTTNAALTISVPGPVTCEGIGDASTSTGAASGGPVTTLTISGPGPITLPSGTWPFECGISANNMILNVPIIGSGAIIQHNNGAMSLYGTNSYSGGTTMTGGQVISYNNNNSFGTGTINITSSPGSSLLNTSGSLVTLPNAFSINNGGQVLNFGQGNVACAGSWTLLATPQLKNNAANTTLTISGAISGTFGLDMLCDNTGAQITLSGANTYTGVTSIGLNGAGATTIVNVSSINSVTTPAQQSSSSLGKPSSVANGTIAMGYTTIAGEMIYSGSGETSDRVINLAGTTGGAIIEMDGAGPLVLTSAFTATGAGAKTLTLQGSSTAANTIAGAIVNSSSATSLTKAQAGTWVLSGVNTYTGNTAVNAGTLQIGDGATHSGAVAGAISVTSPANLIFAQASGGSYTYNGNAQVISGTGAVTVNGPGTLIIGGNHNTYTGSTIINGGILQTGGDQTSGNKAANLGETPNSSVANDIILNGGTLQGNNQNFACMPNRGITLTANSGLSCVATGNALPPLQGELGIQGVITDTSSGNGGAGSPSGITITGQTNLTTHVLSGVYLEGVNTYYGPTVVQSGILSLYYNGSFNNSSMLSISNGAALDVSSNYSNPWVLNQPLTANGTGLGYAGYLTPAPSQTALLIGYNGGAINFQNEPLYLTITPNNLTGDAAQPALYVSQGSLQLSGNTVYVTNNGAGPLGAGIYTLIQLAPGNTISASGAPSLAGGIVYGNGIVAGMSASLVVNGGALNLVVSPPGANPAPYFFNIVVTPSTLTYGSASSVTVTGTVSNTANGVAASPDSVTVTIDGSSQSTSTFDASGNFSVVVPLPAVTPAGYTPAGSYAVSSSYSGALGSGSATDTSASLEITPAQLVVTVAAQNKLYSGNTSVTYTLATNANGDVVNIALQPAPATSSAAFASPNVGTGIGVSVGWLEITGGANAGNWYLPPQTTVTTTANITTTSQTWNGNDYVTSPDWSDANNWVSATMPDAAGDSLDFTGSQGPEPLMQAAYTVWELTFDNAAATPFVITNTGIAGAASLSVGMGGITNNSALAQTFAVPVANLTSFSSQWYVTGGSSLVMRSNVSDAGGGITLSGAGILNLAGSNNAITGPLTNMAGTIEVTGTAKLNNETYAGAIANNGAFIYGSISNQTLNGVISGTGSFALTSSATLIVNGINTFTGGTTLGGGVLTGLIQVSNDVAFGTPPATPTVNITFDGACLKNNGTGNLVNLDADRILTSAGGFPVLFDAGYGTFGKPATSSPITVNSQITGSGGVYINLDSSAVVLANPANNFTGGLVIGTNFQGFFSTGTCAWLQCGAVNVIPSGAGYGNVLVNGAWKGYFDLNGYNQTINGLTGTNGCVTNSTGAAILSVGANNAVTTYGGVITNGTGALGLTVLGGSLTLTNATNTYTLATTINSGATLALGVKGAISNSASIAIAGGGTFDVSGLTATTFNLSASTTLSASGTGASPAAIKGNASSGIVNLGAQAITLNYTPATFSSDSADPALTISQGTLSVNGNSIAVNNTTVTPLGNGTYVIVQTPNPITVVSAPVLAGGVVGGAGIGAGGSVTLSVSGNNIILTVSGVTPTTPPSPNITLVKFTSPGVLSISATNGTPNGPYRLMETTNLSIPVTNWNVVNTGNYDNNGDVTVPYTVNPSDAAEFFSIQNP